MLTDSINDALFRGIYPDSLEFANIMPVHGSVFGLVTPFKIFFQNCEIPSCFLENMNIDE